MKKPPSRPIDPIEEYGNSTPNCMSISSEFVLGWHPRTLDLWIELDSHPSCKPELSPYGMIPEITLQLASAFKELPRETFPDNLMTEVSETLKDMRCWNRQSRDSEIDETTYRDLKTRLRQGIQVIGNIVDSLTLDQPASWFKFAKKTGELVAKHESGSGIYFQLGGV